MIVRENKTVFKVERSDIGRVFAFFSYGAYMIIYYAKYNQ